MQEDIQEEPASPEARRQAKLLIEQGFEAARLLPPATPKEIWTKFDAVRLRIQDELEKRNRVGNFAATECDLLTDLDDAYWAARAASAEAGDFATADEVAKLNEDAGASDQAL